VRGVAWAGRCRARKPPNFFACASQRIRLVASHASLDPQRRRRTCAGPVRQCARARRIARHTSPTNLRSRAQLHTLAQSKYTPSGQAPSALSLGPDAYVYTPAACNNGAGLVRLCGGYREALDVPVAAVSCRLIVAFHGCQQTLSDIGFGASCAGRRELKRNGLVSRRFYRPRRPERACRGEQLYRAVPAGHQELPWAHESRGSLLHAAATIAIPLSRSAQGCFDWWGYTDGNYANRDGTQMATVKAMIAALEAGLDF
jgi:hypothetical protein